MLVLVGEFRSVRETAVTRKDGSPVLRKDGTQWIRREARIMVGTDADFTETVELVGRSLDGEGWCPEPGNAVAFECSIETRAVGDRVYRTYKAWRVFPESFAAELLAESHRQLAVAK